MSQTIRQALWQPLLQTSAEQVEYVINADLVRWKGIGEFYIAQVDAHAKIQ